MATAPINKAALKEAHVPFIGHTELLASLLGEERVTTMLATTGLRVVHVTRHVPLAQVAGLITRENVLETTLLTDAGLKQMGIPHPRIAVAALNPHGGDEGLMGREEIEAIGPAVQDARELGIEAMRPHPRGLGVLPRHPRRVRRRRGHVPRPGTHPHQDPRL